MNHMASTAGAPGAAADLSGILRECSGERGDLIPLLQKLQHTAGFISADGVRQIALALRITENEVYGVASFYSQFRFTPPGRHSIKVCLGTACHVRGGQIISDAVSRELGVAAGETTPDRRFDFQRVACLGCCALEPVVAIDGKFYPRVTARKLPAILAEYQD